MNERIESCVYCGLKKKASKRPKCHFCEMTVGDEYIMHMDPENRMVTLCSINCMDLFEESMVKEAD